MRKIDEQKKQTVEQAVLTITKEEGIQGLSFGKIAKRAHVSSGAPYVYFEDKTDMLSKMYIKAKVLFDESLQADIDSGQSMEKKIFLSVSHFARMYLDHPLEAMFITEVRANPKLITEKARVEGSALAHPLVDLYQAAAKQDMLVSDNLEFVTLQLFAPFMMLITDRLAADQSVTLDELNEIIMMSVKGILR